MNQNNLPTTGDASSTISSHNGTQGRFRPSVKGGLPPLDAGHYLGTGKGKCAGGVLTGYVHVAHVPGQAPETFPAQALHLESGPGRSQDLHEGDASASDAHGAIGGGSDRLHHAAFRTASPTPSFMAVEAASRTAPLPDESGRAARLQEVLKGPSGRGAELYQGDHPQLPVRNFEDPPWGHPLLAEDSLKRHPLAAFEVPPGGPQLGVEVLSAGRPQYPVEVLPAGRPQLGEEGIFSLGAFLAHISNEMGAGSLSFCRGNAPTYDSDRGDVLHAPHQRHAGLAPSGVQNLTAGANRGGYSAFAQHQEMGVEGGCCGGRDLVDRTPGTQMFRPAHRSEMKGGKGRPGKSDQLGQPEPLRPSLARTRDETWGGDARTSPAGSSDVQTGRSTSRNDQGVVNARSTSRNGPEDQGVLLQEQDCRTRNSMPQPRLPHPRRPGSSTS
jgi:hypothetical protein